VHSDYRTGSCQVQDTDLSNYCDPVLQP
jgi:hypothetical protein